MFVLDKRDLNNLNKFYKKAPRKFARANASVLNEYAFTLRRTSVGVIGQKMTVRNPRFVASRMRVQKARPSESINQQEAISGSIRSPRFTGWEEQETGRRPSKNRFATLFARGGDEGRQVRPILRMKPGRRFLSQDDFPGNSAENRVVVMLAMLSRQKYKKPFIVRGHRRMKAGLYKFHRRKLMRVQTFEKPQIKRVPWMRQSQKKTFARLNMRDVWAREIRRVLK